MKLLNRAKLSILITDLVVWTLAMLFYILLRFVGLNDAPFISIDESFEFGMLIRITMIGGLLLGIVYGITDIILDQKWFRKQRFSRGLLIKGSVHFIIIILISVLVRIRAFHFLGIDVTAENLFKAMVGPELIMLFIYVSLVSFFLNFMRQIDQKLGPGNLWKFLTGKFHEPKEEQRIFMFLDLKSSTTIAEALGHIKFSQLLQDCFNDLSIVGRRRAEVYQYVGDEAILTWDLDNGLQDGNCMRAFYDFQNELKRRDVHYQKAYGISPQFKAGINLGKVTVAEIGSLKREIAFHGDTLNTASRIQDQCNQYQENLLISESLQRQLGDLPGLALADMGSFNLKGKTETITIYAVNPQPSTKPL